MIKMLLNPVKHTLAVLKVVAVAKVLVESDGKVAAVLGVVLAELLLQGLGRLLGMVKGQVREDVMADVDRKSTRLNSSHGKLSRMPSSA